MSFWKIAKSEKMFRRYLAALFLWEWTQWMLITAIPLFLHQRYGLGKEFVFSIVIELIPAILLGPVIGSWIDRWGAKRVTILDIAAYSILVTLLPLTSSLWQVQLILLGIGISQTAGSPASLTLRAGVIPKGMEIQGNAAVMGIERLCKIIGPLAASMIILAFGTGVTLQLCCFAGLAAFALFFTLPVAESEEKAEDESGFGNAVSSALPSFFRLLGRDRMIIAFVVTAIGYSLLMGMLKIFLLSLAGLHGDPKLYWGLFLAAQGLGALAGAIVCDGIVNRLTRTYSLTWVYFLFGLGEAFLLTGLAFQLGLTWTLLVLVLAAVFEIVATIIYFSVIQTRIPYEQQGLFNSMTLPVLDACYAAGIMLSGALLTALPIYSVLLTCLGFMLVTHLPFVKLFFRERSAEASTGSE
ncbi:MFS transporter [Brevibacillus borstelensis]|uniref:MFS transporter n=1 Tax=Brevibacillus borstelensis TaxID=45462 RepID=UPI0030BE516F